MKKVALLYICTGKYYLFWKDFYVSCEKYFLKGCEIHYYVFVDQDSIYAEDNERVHRVLIDAMPWPLITLLRFHIFLRIEKDLQNYDYMFFMNANMQCVNDITEKDILPEKGQELVVTQHAGYLGKKPRFVGSFDRNPCSTAYIPYHVKCDSVIGALIGGTRDGFLHMSKQLKKNIDKDLQNRVIAMWHDESHLNHYIILHNNYKLLSPAFCYPEEMTLNYEPKIMMVDKQRKFDVNKFKGCENVKESFRDKIWRNINKILPYQDVLYVRDWIFRKKVR